MSAFKKPNTLTTETYPDMMLDLEVLYIPSNMSGRIKFLQKWPDLANYLFDKALIQRDSEGGFSDSETIELEDQAELLRVDLYEAIDNLEERCLHFGALKTEETKAIIEKIGEELSALVFLPEVIEKALYIPPIYEEEDEAYKNPQAPPV